jgi:DNA-binding beta-propeller fold protein YncE
MPYDRRMRMESVGMGRWIVAGALALALGCGGSDGRESGSGESSGLSISISVGEPSTTEAVDDTGEKLDVLAGGDGGPGNGGDCPGGGGGMDGDVEFSLIWIANSPAGHVSKIDTQTGIELGRYYTGPTNGDDDPSRTSVNLAGDVAVTNRFGGITKIAAREAQCIDGNGNGVIDTSTGPDDVRPFGEDECMLWHLPLPNGGSNQQGPRPTAWDAGPTNNPCAPADFRLWVGYYDIGVPEGHFYRLDGSDGTILDEVTAPGWDPTGTNYGPYGGAVDGEGNFWVTGLFGNLVRIDAATLDVRRWDTPVDTDPYGMTVDSNGDPWTAGWNGHLTHFDTATETFEVFQIGPNTLRGLQIDRNGMLWAAVNGNCGVAQFDTNTLSIVTAQIPLPGCDTPVGVSIDVDGFVWVPDQGANLAFKMDPVTYQATVTEGLIAPYTYSDMTGAGLGLVYDPPQG